MLSTSIQLDSKRLSGLIGLGYEAALDRSAWRAFAGEAATAFGCQLAIVEYQDQNDPQTAFLVAGGLDGFEEVFSASRTHRANDDYFLAIYEKPGGTVKLGSEVVAPDAMHRSDSYSRLAMPWRLEHFLFGSIVTGNGVHAIFSLGRTGREAPFVEGDKTVISELLLSHLRRSFNLHRDLATIRRTNTLLGTVISHTRALRDPQESPVVLKTVYGLSPAEVRLCQSLIQGLTLVETAVTLNISRNTAKTHLGRVFEKTGTHSQADLLRLLVHPGLN